MERNNLFKGREVIDCHLHMHTWEGGPDSPDWIDGLEEFREKFGFRALNLLSTPGGKRGVTNNMACALYKVAHENTYSYGGLTYPQIPVDVNQMGDMDPLTQYRELMEIGFDGIKMLEGKPNMYKTIGIPFYDPFYQPFFSAIEKDGTHVLLHANDPDEFWDSSKMEQEQIEKGWYYGDGTHIKYEEMYDQIDRLMEAHPNLHLTMCHFFFLAKHPEKLEAYFEKYKHFGVDITPGGEMYLSFRERPEYYRDFFIRHADRIMYGTDGECPANMPPMEWLTDRVYRIFATDDDVMAWGEGPTRGFKLPDSAVNQIFCGNFLREAGEKPREINKKALKAYIEKYKHLIKEDWMREKILKLAAELLG